LYNKRYFNLKRQNKILQIILFQFVYISTPFMRTKGFWMKKKKKMVSQKVMELSCLWNMIVKAHSLIRVFLPLAHLKPWSCWQSKKLTKLFSWLYVYIYIYIHNELWTFKIKEGDRKAITFQTSKRKSNHIILIKYITWQHIN